MADSASYPERINHPWTPRQREVLDLIVLGKTNPEIAGELGISLAGVKWHVSEVLSILGVDSREEAASYWRSANSLAARGRRWLAGMAGLVSLKATASAAGLAAFTGAGLMVAGTWQHNDAAGQELAAPPSVNSLPPGSMKTADMVVITSIPLEGGGEARLLGAKTAAGLCLAVERAPFSSVHWCPSSAQHLAFQGGFGYSRLSVHHGATGKEAERVEVALHDGTSLIVTLAVAPPELGIDVKFYLFAVPKPELVGTVRAMDGAGNVLESFTLFDPPGTPVRWDPPPPLETIDSRWSSRADPATGSVPFAGGRRGATVSVEGGTYRFRVEHDGALQPRIVLWCQTGIIPLAYEDGPDAAGNGSIVARIPRDSAACFFHTQDFDGTCGLWGWPLKAKSGWHRMGGKRGRRGSRGPGVR